MSYGTWASPLPHMLAALAYQNVPVRIPSPRLIVTLEHMAPRCYMEADDPVGPRPNKDPPARLIYGCPSHEAA